MALTIKGSYDTEVYVTKGGYVALKQTDQVGQEDQTVLLAPHQLPHIIMELQSLWETRNSWESNTEDDEAGNQSTEEKQ